MFNEYIEGFGEKVQNGRSWMQELWVLSPVQVPHAQLKLEIYSLTSTYYRLRKWTSVEIIWFFPALWKQTDAEMHFLNLQQEE